MSGMAAVLMVLAIAALVLVAVGFWRTRKHTKKSKCCSSSSKCSKCGCSASAFDFRTDIFAELEAVTGGGGSGMTGMSDSGFLTVLSTNIKTCGKTNTLFCDVSAESAILLIESDSNATGTTIVSSTSGEAATLEMQVLVDGLPIAPGTITFDSLTHAVTTNLLPGDAKTELVNLAEANAFTFIAPGISAGTHTVLVQARLTAAASATAELLSFASAVLASRTLTVTPACV